MKIEIPQNVTEEFEQYCKLNEIKEIGDLAFRCFISGFNIEKYGEKIVEKEIPITDDSKIQEFLTEIQELKDQYKNLENITGEKDSQLMTLSSQTEYYQTQIKGLQNEITRQKEGPLKKLMRGDFLRGSNMNNNLYD